MELSGGDLAGANLRCANLTITSPSFTQDDKSDRWGFLGKQYEELGHLTPEYSHLTGGTGTGTPFSLVLLGGKAGM